jgi:sodium-dependent dicarboxylate transporter 2/3/5
MSVMPAPAGFSAASWAAAAAAVWIAIWWFTEAAPLAATALLPLLLFPMAGIRSLGDTASAYGDPVLFLFLGGFVISQALQESGLHRRIARFVVRRSGRRPAARLAGVMGATAFLSMWISNTASAIMMVPIALSIARSIDADDAERGRAIEVAFLLAIAYGASIGGVATLIGTPPNALAAAYLGRVHGIQIGFSHWLLIGLPTVLILLPACWFMLSRALPAGVPMGVGEDGLLADVAPPPSRAEIATAAVFGTAAVAWIVRPVLNDLWPGLPIGDTSIAIAAAVLLFALPVRRADGARLLGQEDVSGLPWHVLILFGGGLALAGAIADTGLAASLGKEIAALGGSSAFLVTVALVAFIVLLTEVTSNTATAAAFLPIAGAVAVQSGADILAVVAPVTLAASCAFMMPVATPPNAVVFGTGRVRLGDMMRAGIRMNLVAMATLIGLAWLMPWGLFAAR